jgi:hypothetical protein
VEPLLDELDRADQAVSTVGRYTSSAIGQSSVATLASTKLSSCWAFRSSSRIVALNDSIQAFCQGEPRSIETVPAPVHEQQSATA